MSFADNLKQLPGVSHLAELQLLDAEDGSLVATIANQPGQTGSLAIYNHLAQHFGVISADAARKGLELYAEHAAEARSHPGKHPHIDRLIKLLEEPRKLRVKPVFSVD